MSDVLGLANAIAHERQGVYGKSYCDQDYFVSSFCPTLSYYFEEDLNAVADSPYPNSLMILYNGPSV